MARNTVGMTLFGLGVFSGIPATLYAFSELNSELGVISLFITAAFIGLGIQSENTEDAREREKPPE